jgi:hypothetical protein
MKMDAMFTHAALELPVVLTIMMAAAQVRLLH